MLLTSSQVQVVVSSGIGVYEFLIGSQKLIKHGSLHLYIAPLPLRICSPTKISSPAADSNTAASALTKTSTSSHDRTHSIKPNFEIIETVWEAQGQSEITSTLRW